MIDHLWEVQKMAVAGLSKRFQAVSENLANINTPRYQRKEVLFEEALRKAAGLTQEEESRLPLARSGEDEKETGEGMSARPPFSPVETRVTDEEYRLDGNNVDPEIEMAKLAETRLAYSATMRLMAKRAEMLRIAMGGR